MAPQAERLSMRWPRRMSQTVDSTEFVDDIEIGAQDPEDYIQKEQAIIQAYESSCKKREEKTKCGNCYVLHVPNRLREAKEHGGDFATRFHQATKAALGSFIIFSALSWTHQPYLGAVWVGNLFFLVAMKENFGASLIQIQDFGKSLILVTAFSWPLAYFMTYIPESVAEIILPFVVFCASFLIMTCPWLESRNLMVVPMYIVVAIPVREDAEWWDPANYLATYLVGLAVALLMNLLPLFGPTLATRSIHKTLVKLEQDTALLLLRTQAYTNSAGQSSQLMEAAVASIEVLTNRIDNSMKELSKTLPAAKKELELFRRHEDSKRLCAWIANMQQLSRHFKMLQTMLTQRFLGEELVYKSPYSRDVGRIIATEVGPHYRHFMEVLTKTIVECIHHADPHHPASVKDIPDPTVLVNALASLRNDFSRALELATQMAQETDTAQPTVTSLFAHLARRMTSSHSIFAIAEGMATYCQDIVQQSNESLNIVDSRTEAAKSEHSRPGGLTILSQCVKSRIQCLWNGGLVILNYLLDNSWRPKWLLHTPEARHIATKTAFGMLIASLWISIPYLNAIADPFGIWPGITVASVTLSTRGSSFLKAFDRLVGTLFAAAFALLVVHFFPGNQDYIKIPAITLFTFVAVYLRSEDRSYLYTYAAISSGAMFYGRGKIVDDVEGYISQRIELIFIGVVIFALVELFLFPRSSRRLVEMASMDFFDSLHAFLQQATKLATHIERHSFNKILGVKEDEDRSREDEQSEESEYSHLLRGLLECHMEVKSTSAILRIELPSALTEPYFGFSQRLDSGSLTGMVKGICEADIQTSLLVSSLEKLQKDLQNDCFFFRKLNWPHAYASFLKLVTLQMENCLAALKDAFPDGRLRPQCDNSLMANAAVSSFRGFADARHEIIASWSIYYQDYIRSKSANVECSNPNEILTLGLTTSFVLEFCRHLQDAGKNLEGYANKFPSYPE
jgi:uncharacterized membrane protein YgaE (UPF0421/DUF939 family)